MEELHGQVYREHAVAEPPVTRFAQSAGGARTGQRTAHHFHEEVEARALVQTETAQRPGAAVGIGVAVLLELAVQRCRIGGQCAVRCNDGPVRQRRAAPQRYERLAFRHQ